MESGSESKSWDHAWTTEEMRENRRKWSLAGDTGLLKHLEQFSDNITKKAEETKDALNSMTAQLNETTILVDNITNSSLALANTQFIESRVQEDNTEIEQPVESAPQKEVIQEYSADDLLSSLYESIKQGLKIIDEKFEKVEVVASDSEDDDNSMPSYILKPKDPYKHRRLPYIIDSEEWKASSKVGLETSSSSSSSESDDDEDAKTEAVEDSKTEAVEKNVVNTIGPTSRMNLGIGKLSSTSSESNISNVESSSIKGNEPVEVQARSQDTLTSGTEVSTPSSSLPKAQPVNTGLPSFAEELAKRLGNVFPVQKNVIIQDTSEKVSSPSGDDLFSQKDDQEVFSNKSDSLFTKGKNLFSDEESSSWKTKPAKPVNKSFIPPSLDVPPPLSVISSAPKSNIDDLFGDADESDNSDDIFSKKPSEDLSAAKKEVTKSDIPEKQSNLSPGNLQNTVIMTGNAPQTSNKGKSLFEDDDNDDDDDLFKPAAKQVKPPETSPQSFERKKPVGGVSIFGRVDILSSTKFPRRASSSSSSDAEDSGSNARRPGKENRESVNPSRRENNSSVFSPPGADNNAAGSLVASSNNSSSNINSGNSDATSGISMKQPSSDNTGGSSLGADFQPLMSSNRAKSEELYRERVSDDGLLTSTKSVNQPQPIEEDASEENSEDVCGPPPLPKPGDASSRNKSKVASLFDDSDSDSDLFASASPSSLRSQRSSEPTPSKSTAGVAKKKSIFDDDEDDDDLFGSKDASQVGLFTSAPEPKSVPTGKVQAKSKVNSLFDDEDDDLFADVKKTDLFGEPSVDLFGDSRKGKGSQLTGLFGGEIEDNLFGDSKKVAVAKPDSSKPKTSFGEVKGSTKPSSLFSDGEIEPEEDDLFGSYKKSITQKKAEIKAVQSTKQVTEPEVDDLFVSPKQTDVEKIVEVKPKVDQTTKQPTSVVTEPEEDDLFASSKKTVVEKTVEVKSKVDQTTKQPSSAVTEPEEDDLFASSKQAVVEKTVEIKPKVDQTTKQPSSVVTEPEQDDLFASSEKTVSVSAPTEDDLFDSSNKVGSEKKVEIKPKVDQTSKKTSSVVTEPKEDDLFASSKNTISEKKVKVKQVGLISKQLPIASAVEPDDDLFSRSKKTVLDKKKTSAEVEVTQVGQNPKQQSSSLVSGSEEDELFSSSKKIATEKKVGGKVVVQSSYQPNSSLSEADELFSSSIKTAIDRKQSNAKVEVKPVNQSSKQQQSILKTKSKDDSVDSSKKTASEVASAKSSIGLLKETVKVEVKQKKGLFEDDSEDSDIFAKVPKSEKSSGSKKGLFEDSSDSELFGSSSKKSSGSTPSVSKESAKDIHKAEPEVSKKLTTSIFDDSDDEDLFASSSKKKTSSTLKQDKSITEVKKMDEDRKNIDTEKKEEKSSLLDDDDDDDDLFGDKKKKEKLNVEAKSKTEPAAKAVLAEIKQKLEKHKLLEKKPESAVDGAVISRKEPPKTLKIQPNLPAPVEDAQPAAPKKPVVSGKIKNLMGKMDFKILSPTDTPPLPRKSTEEKSSSENELEASGETAASEESTPSIPSGASSPQTSGAHSRTRESPSSRSDNTEVAISFDEPAQIETLSSISKSKSRVRIPAKRRPQSRQARHSALLHSGIDFDIVDASSTSPLEPQANGDAEKNHVDRLLPSRTSHPAEDRSEISISRNTTTNLLSPSTDEEDLFDVPPDLPEDPSVKEDSLFGRAPILSPIESVQRTKEEKNDEKKAEVESVDEPSEKKEKGEKKEPSDPLRDDRHDPLNDPSQLFAFVTKTSSPEKSKGLLVNEDDDSLFSSSTKPAEKALTQSKTGLFDDEDESSSDLFSSSKSKLSKKTLKDTKIDLFDDAGLDDDDDSLFGSVSKKSQKTKIKEPSPPLSNATETDKKSDSQNPKSGIKDIFDDSSSEDDIYAGNKKTVIKKKTASLFDDDGTVDNDDIFAKPKLPSMKESGIAAVEVRPALKKVVTKDLKKTAEKTVEDPLSLLQDE